MIIHNGKLINVEGRMFQFLTDEEAKAHASSDYVDWYCIMPPQHKGIHVCVQIAKRPR